MKTLDADIEQFKAVGHGALALVNAGILLAIAAVILSKRSGTPAIISQALGLLTWLTQQIVRPISGGYNVPLTANLAPAFGGGSGGTGGTSSTGTSGTGLGGTGTGSNFLNSQWDQPNQSGWDIPSQTGTTGAGGTGGNWDIPTMTITPSGSGGF